jgi:type IV fimbrial biogenesis protein FimT
MVTRMNRLSSKHRARQGCSRKPPAGFTLIEVLSVITIAAILMAFAVPSYLSVTNSNRIASEVNGLLSDMQYARSEAIKEGQTVSICSSSNATTCSGVPVWANGWIIFSDVNGDGAVNGADTILRAGAPFAAGDTFNANNGMKFVTFNREGFALGLANTTTVTLHAAVPNATTTRCLQITIIGQLATEKAGVGACT